MPSQAHDPDRLAEMILRGTDAAGKTYVFNEGHDPTKPTQWWFQESNEGLVLFVVFYTQACRWSRCLSCNLPSTCSKHNVPWRDLLAQINFLFALPEVQEKKGKIRQFIASNNGSVLDQDTFSSMALMHLIIMANLHFPNLEVFTVETRPEYVELAELDYLARGLSEGDTPTALEMAIGFEAFDEHVRNDLLFKGLTLDKVERLVAAMSVYGFRLKCYLMLKPVPSMTREESIADIHHAIEYLTQLSEKHLDPKTGEPMVRINIHVNPTYVAKGTPLEPAFAHGDYKPPTLRDVALAVLPSEASPLTVFISLYDEGLAVPGGSFRRPGDEALATLIASFNSTQDYDFLRRVLELTEQ